MNTLILKFYKLFKLSKEEDVSFVFSRRSENKEIVNIVKIIMYLQNTVSIHPIFIRSRM
uniref:Ycf2 N-terminal domain-containing protein n=1 Tax=Fagonia indica TaxID=66629 RepID=A0A6C0UA76_9ROSI|nr:hypothetical protein [Fagonia indica]